MNIHEAVLQPIGAFVYCNRQAAAGRRKSYMSFRLVPKSVTLYDIERRNGVILRYFSEFG